MIQQTNDRKPSVFNGFLVPCQRTLNVGDWDVRFIEEPIHFPAGIQDRSRGAI